MSRLRIAFPSGDALEVPRMFADGMCDVFKDSDTIHAGALDYSVHAELIRRIANVFSHTKSTTHVRLVAKVATLSSDDVITVLEFANYFGHEYVVDTAASILAKRLPRLSRREIQALFRIDETREPARIPVRYMIRHVPPLAW